MAAVALLIVLRLIGWRPRPVSPRHALRNLVFGVVLLAILYVVSELVSPFIALVAALALLAGWLLLTLLRHLRAGPGERP